MISRLLDWLDRKVWVETGIGSGHAYGLTWDQGELRLHLGKYTVGVGNAE